MTLMYAQGRIRVVRSLFIFIIPFLGCAAWVVGLRSTTQALELAVKAKQRLCSLACIVHGLILYSLHVLEDCGCC